MLRGLIAGGLSGLVVGGSALAVLSVMNEPPAGNAPPASPQVQAPDEAAPADIASAVPDTVADDSTGDAIASSAPQVDVPQPVLTAPVADTTPAGIPETGEAGALQDAPEIGAAPEVDLGAVEPVLPNPQSIAPQVPAGEQDVAVSTEPAAAPDMTQEEPEAETEPAAQEVASVEPADETVAEAAPEVASEVDAPTTEEQIATAPEAEETAPEPAVEAVEEPVAEADADPTEDTATEEIAALAPEQPQAPAVVSIVPEASTSLPGGDTGVAVRRLTDQPEEPEEAGPEVAVDPNAPAIEKYAARFDNPDDKPMIAVVLIDDGSLQGAASAVASLELPVTVVLDPDQDDVAQKMTDYRSAGVEVAVRAALPAAATAADVEAAFGVSFAKVPESVLLIDDGTAGLQNNRAITEFAMETLGQDGRGFLTISSGLNTALRLAEQNGVPAGVIYRDLDRDGQDARVIRRFLDQAAFRARQDDVVFLLGRVRPDTISALILWGTANRADQVVFAPASAALVAKDQ